MHRDNEQQRYHYHKHQRILMKGTTLGSNLPFISYGGFGRVLEQHNPSLVTCAPRNLVYMNTNTPSSTIIYGVQGSGKSHSVGVIVENSLIRLQKLGSLPSRLSITIFHLSATQGGMHASSLRICICSGFGSGR